MPPLSNQASFLLALPEICLTVGALVILLLGLLFPRLSRWTGAALTVGAAGAALVATLLTAPDAPRGLFGGLTARDPFGDFFRLLACLATVVVALLATRARDTIDPQQGDREAPEFFALLLTAALGVMLMASATDMLLAYLGLELVSMMSYILAGFTRGVRRSAEAALKYVIYGGVASAALLYGMSLVYGFTGETRLAPAFAALRAAPVSLNLVAVALCLAGLGYKVAVVPFHMWCPDVYEGAPTPVAAFLSVAPKAGGFALLLRFFGAADPSSGVVLGTQASAWSLLALVIAVMTMTLGNLAALGQSNIKRLLAYSAIAHAGYLFLGVAVGPPGGHLAILFYLGVYLFMSLGAFAVVAAVVDQGGGEGLAAFSGLGRRQPLAAFVLTVVLFGLAGLPPTGGFVAKYYMFSAVVARGRELHEGMFYVAAVIAVLNSVVSVYYYAKVVRAMYLEPPGEGLPGHLPAPLPALLLALLIPTVALGIYWAPLDDLVRGSLATWVAVTPAGP
jgi:NADH-quinone oxidoreductase subunit N